MSSGMNMQEAEKVAENMSYRQAVINCLYARCVPYRKATKIKMRQLLEIVENNTEKVDDIEKSNFNPQMFKACLDTANSCGYHQGRADAIDKMVLKIETDMPSELDEKERYGYTVALSILLEQMKEQNNVRV